MSVFLLARRRPTQGLRLALAAALLAFALNSIAHVVHRHDATPVSAAHSVACGYCVSFGGLADAPRHTYHLPARHPIGLPITLLASAPRPALLPSAQPRAPPDR